MVPGFLLEKGDSNWLGRTEWLEGEPEKSFWSGIKTEGRERLPVSTFRCPKCGYLESYAGEE